MLATFKQRLKVSRASHVSLNTHTQSRYAPCVCLQVWDVSSQSDLPAIDAWVWNAWQVVAACQALVPTLVRARMHGG